MKPPNVSPKTRKRWQLSLVCVCLGALLAACTGAPVPLAAATPERALSPTRTSAPTAGAATPPGDQAASEEQEALYNRWYTPVVASLYPYLICQSNVAALDGTETGEARDQAAAAIAVRANAGREVLAFWEPPEEHLQIRTDALAYLNLLIEVSRQWYREEIDGAGFRQQMGELCQGAEGLLKDTAFLAREEGLTLESMQAISDRFEQALANP